MTDSTLPHFKPRRSLGRTGFVATVLGIGDLADRALPLDELVATARRAMDAGLNLIDTAPGYESGYSEQVVGRALQGRRDGMFVIDKIDFPDKPVGPQVDASLANLGLDHTDLFVFHAVSSMTVLEKLLSPGDGFDQLDACVRAGKTRFRGLSGHHPLVLAEAIRSGACDVVMFPVGPLVDQRYIDMVLPLARKHNVGTVCFKTFGAGRLVADTLGYNRPLQQRPRGKMSSGGGDGEATREGPVLPHLGIDECVHYTMTCDPDVALLGMSYPNEQDAALHAAAAFVEPLSVERMRDIHTRALTAIEGKGGRHWDPTDAA